MDAVRDCLLVLIGAGAALFLAGLLLPASRPCVLCVHNDPDPRPSRN